MRANFVVSGMWEGIRRNATMTIALILNTAIAFSFVGGAILANKEIDKFKKQYESSLNVSVFLCAATNNPPCTKNQATTADQTKALQAKLTADPMVDSVSYVSQQEAYERARTLQAPEVRNLIRPGDLPASFTVVLKDLRKDYTAFALKYDKEAGVSGVKNRIAALTAILDIIDNFRLLAIGIAAIVLIASILLIANTIQVAAAQRRNETSIMRLVGASRTMTELPFMLETIISAFVGGLMAFGLLALGKYLVLTGIFSKQVEAGVIPPLNVNDVLEAAGISLIGGVVLAGLTAFATLRLYVKL